jgi:hypothetical protein
VPSTAKLRSTKGIHSRSIYTQRRQPVPITEIGSTLLRSLIESDSDVRLVFDLGRRTVSSCTSTTVINLSIDEVLEASWPCNTFVFTSPQYRSCSTIDQRDSHIN